MKRTIEIDDDLQERVDGAIEELKTLLLEYLDQNPDTGETPCLSNDLDHDGRFHEIVDGYVPNYTKEIDGLFYLYGFELEEAFDNAGIGEKKDGQDGFPCGWKAAAIFCYIEQECWDWWDNNAEDVFEDWKNSHLDCEECGSIIPDEKGAIFDSVKRKVFCWDCFEIENE